jgi:hypothetical protein
MNLLFITFSQSEEVQELEETFLNIIHKQPLAGLV